MAGVGIEEIVEVVHCGSGRKSRARGSHGGSDSDSGSSRENGNDDETSRQLTPFYHFYHFIV